MGGVNGSRLMAGGLAAGVLIWLMEGGLSILYIEDMLTALSTHGLSMEMTPTMIGLTIVVSLLTGLALVFFYALARPRLGPGPRTAVIVAIGLWTSGWLVTLIGYQMIGLYPTRSLVIWGFAGIIELTVASVLGAWVYREA